MARYPSTHIPQIQRHATNGRAFVAIRGRQIPLGPWPAGADGPPADVLAEYNRIIGEWLANGRVLADESPLSVRELLAAYMDHAAGYYVKTGKPTKEVGLLADAAAFVGRKYNEATADTFDACGLRAVREDWIAAGRVRTQINAQVHRVRRIWRWGVEMGLVSSDALASLQAVAALKAGRTAARDNPDVPPAPEEAIEPVKAAVGRQVRAMIDVQLWTGMRPGEVVIMRGCDLDMTDGAVWLYTPGTHKTEHHGYERPVWIGPRAQEVIRPFLKADLSDYLFSPADAEAELLAARRASRKTKVQPSQANRRKADPKIKPGDCYTPDSYRKAIGRACRRAGIAHWHPHQLRHNCAGRLEEEFGIEVAQYVLGHSTPAMTRVYSRANQLLAKRAMAQSG